MRLGLGGHRRDIFQWRELCIYRCDKYDLLTVAQLYLLDCQLTIDNLIREHV